VIKYVDGDDIKLYLETVKVVIA